MLYLKLNVTDEFKARCEAKRLRINEPNAELYKRLIEAGLKTSGVKNKIPSAPVPEPKEVNPLPPEEAEGLFVGLYYP